ncbi:capping complex subunit for YIEGIA [Marinicrinis lubricantis]|uniref:Uncharacterized protein n=1 Tax=Marinicrinis lubricantis TaxID=2086470 RepID=A0ABW1ISQ4_9BACL
MLSEILAVITLKHNPTAQSEFTFFANDDQELQDIAFKLEKILDASAHDIGNGTMIIVQRK